MFRIALLLLTCLATAIAQDTAPNLHPELASDSFKGQILIKVESETNFNTWVRQFHPEWEIITYGKGLLGVRNYAGGRKAKLADAPGLLFADLHTRKATTESLPGAFDHTLNGIVAARAEFSSINGSNTRLSIKEKPFDVNDIDLRGRIDGSGPFDEPATNHATFMATIAAGAGNTSENAKGSAWAAMVTTSDFDRLLPDADATLRSAGITVQNHSYGVGIENYYGIESSEYDRQGVDMPQLLHVFSAGNKGNQAPASGPYAGLSGYANLTGQFKLSKNTLCVGSTDLFNQIPALSSRGPAFDGRIKPEITAIGDAGSSEAAAVVSGIALLVQDAWFKSTHSHPPSAMVKAILINSATDIGRPEVDHESGFGNANALEALRTVDAARTFSGQVGAGDEEVFQIDVPAGTNKLKVTLTWTDPPGTPFTGKALINDLDMVVRRKSDGTEFLPWILETGPDRTLLERPATRGEDHLNNVEQVTISLPSAGAYEIIIKAFEIPEGLQSYHVAYGFSSGLSWLWPVSNSNARPGENRILRWTWNGPEQTASVYYRLLPDGNWIPLAENLSLNSNQLSVTLPEATAYAAFKITSGSEQWTSAPLAIIPQPNLRIRYNCDEGVLMTWSAVEGATGYVLRNLGEKYLEPFSVVSDTLAFVGVAEGNSSWFSVHPVFEGQEIISPRTIDYRTQGVDCYLSGFYAEKFLFDGPARFRLNLGTTYGLTAVNLQRSERGSWKGLLRITNPEQTSLTLTDESPQHGFSRYRVVLERVDGADVLSEEVEIAFAGDADLFVYPNPVQSGAEINVVSDSEELHILRLHDYHGRVLKQSDGIGPVKTIGTTGLPAGIYMLRVSLEDGVQKISRIMIK